ncbi:MULTISPECIES: hypothetical protein [unclassified Neorhizobium]|uniref:hypothetical protein n=1 Tax=unclassified Neorhizobium TaxID=2629175 RepID=UPI001FF5B422|nr:MULTISPECIES: hypothetical protein [unclassified Neorhizobium]MCJ9672230.1 hypothetical protein [Neorhizobium sp. SHOUNA12B]MCJ9748059.1 hypothetical protein [Neorhizobium sp. SHOUNA12A]
MADSELEVQKTLRHLHGFSKTPQYTVHVMAKGRAIKTDCPIGLIGKFDNLEL